MVEQNLNRRIELHSKARLPAAVAPLGLFPRRISPARLARSLARSLLVREQRPPSSTYSTFERAAALWRGLPRVSYFPPSPLRRPVALALAPTRDRSYRFSNDNKQPGTKGKG